MCSYSRECGCYGAAPFCLDLVPFCRVLHQFGIVLPRSASMWYRFAAFCLDLGAVLLRSALILCHFAVFCLLRFAAFCSDLVSFFHVLQRSDAHFFLEDDFIL